MEILFLGTSSSSPLPRKDQCPQCTSEDPKDKRRRTATLVDKTILIDAGPDIFQQFKKYKISPLSLRALLLTHTHFDAAAKVRELQKKNPTLPVYYPKTAKFELNDIKIKTFIVPHTRRIKTQGFLFNKNLVYISDTKDILHSSRFLKRAKYAILDGSGWDKTFPSHQPMKEIIAKIERFKNLKQVYFTHIGHTHFPHQRLERLTQREGGKYLKVAYDGLKIYL